MKSSIEVLSCFRSLLIVMSLSALAADIFASPPFSQSQTQTSEEAIQSTFSQYRKALLESDGSKAADLVDTRTIKLYDEIRTNALEMPRQKLSQLDFISKFMVLRVRHEFSKSQIEKMSGRELFKLGVDKGWISASTVSNVERLARIKIDLHKASASIPQAPNTPALYFLNESGQWKLALWQSFEIANLAMKSEVEKSGLTEEEFVIKTIDALSSKKVDVRILSGPLE